MKIYPPGARIAGRYEVAGRPLLGGMGVVYLCIDHEENRPVALKTFKPKYLPDRAARDRFLREGTHWVKLGAHPHIVRCYQVLRVDPQVYLVLELVAKEEGRADASLRSWLTPGTPLSVEQALLFGLQIARGMAHAASIIPGFVHRDLKPENVLVGADCLTNANVNRLRVTDFGLATVVQESGSKIIDVREGEIQEDGRQFRRTQLTHGMVGTPLYMAPEQWRGEKTSVATDVYALGCILYEMLTGEQAVAGNSVEALEQAHCEGKLRPLPALAPAAMAELVTKCFALEPEARYPGWRELEGGLAKVYAQVTGHAAPDVDVAVVLSRAEQVAAGWSYNAMGFSYLDIGKTDVALDYFERARQMGRVEGKQELEAAALDHLGLAYADLGEIQRAISYYEQALAIHREIRDRRGEGAVLGNLGFAYAALGDMRRAIAYHEKRLEVDRTIGDRHGEAVALGNLGEAHRLLGNVRRAISYYEQALAIHREIRDRRGEGANLGNLGNAYTELGDAQQALGYYEQRLEIAHEIGDRRGESAALSNLGEAYRFLGETRRAVDYFERGLAILREIGDRRGEANVLGNLGNAYIGLGEVQRAIGYYEECLTIHSEIGDRRAKGTILGNLGVAYRNLGNARQAIGCLEHSLKISREIGDIVGIAANSFNMALLHTQQGDASRALPLAQEAAHLFTQIGHSDNAQRAHQLVAQLQRELR